jgi:hypothetical protein
MSIVGVCFGAGKGQSIGGEREKECMFGEGEERKGKALSNSDRNVELRKLMWGDFGRCRRFGRSFSEGEIYRAQSIGLTIVPSQTAVKKIRELFDFQSSIL